MFKPVLPHPNIIRDFLFLSVRRFLVLAENRSDLVVQPLAPVPHVQDLQRLLDGDARLERLVVHQELHQVEQLSRLEARFV